VNERIAIHRRLLGSLLRPIDHLAAAMSWRGLRSFIESTLDNLGPHATVLNVGAGGRTARVVESMRASRGFQVTSIDIDPARGPDVVADVITYAPDTQYDVVLMIEVLEHVLDPFAAVKNIETLLKPGGMLALSTPFLFPVHDRPIDFFRFTHYGLRQLCSGFESTSIRPRDGWAETLCVLLARLFKERSLGAKLFAPCAVLVAAAMYPIATLFSRIVYTDAYTSGYMLHARKAART
jgi:SAM-dependent methyltransferase